MDPSPTFDATLPQVRRNPWLLGLAATPALLSIAAIIAGFTVRPSYFVGTLHPVIFAMIGLAYAWRRNPWPLVEEVQVHADAEGLRAGALLVPRRQIQSAFVLPGPTPMVRIKRRFGLPVELRVGDAAEGRALLRALGLDVSQTVATFRTGSRVLSKRRYTLAAVGASIAVYLGIVATAVNMPRGFHSAGAAAGGLLILGAMLMMGLVFLMPTRLSIGADGIVIRWFGRDRFIGYGEVKQVSRYESGWGKSRRVGITITLRSREEVRLPIGTSQWSMDSVEIIEERLREAMDVFRSGGATADAALLQRGERGVADWVAALRAIGSGANADMRTAPVPRERLFRIVESPTATAADRAAAAIALGSDLDEDGRLRLRGAAEAIAAPKLRVVLETAAGDAEPAELEAAIAELEAEEAKAKSA